MTGDEAVNLMQAVEKEERKSEPESGDEVVNLAREWNEPMESEESTQSVPGAGRQDGAGARD